RSSLPPIAARWPIRRGRGARRRRWSRSCSFVPWPSKARRVSCVAERLLLPRDLEIVIGHHAHQLRERHARGPTQPLTRLGRVAAEMIDLRRAEVSRLDLDVRA